MKIFITHAILVKRVRLNKRAIAARIDELHQWIKKSVPPLVGLWMVKAPAIVTIQSRLCMVHYILGVKEKISLSANSEFSNLSKTKQVESVNC